MGTSSVSVRRGARLSKGATSGAAFVVELQGDKNQDQEQRQGQNQKQRTGVSAPHFLLLGSGGDRVHARGVEDESFDFGFGAGGGDLLAVPEEGDSGGVADSGDDFVGGADGGVGRGDESLLADGLAVGEDGDPGGFVGADDEHKGSSRGVGGLRIWFGEGANGYVVLVVVCLAVYRARICRTRICVIRAGVQAGRGGGRFGDWGGMRGCC